MGVRKLDCNNIPEISKIRTMLKVDFYRNFACFPPSKKSWAALRSFRFRHGSGIRNMFSLWENLCNHKVFSEDPNHLPSQVFYIQVVQECDLEEVCSLGKRKFHHNR